MHRVVYIDNPLPAKELTGRDKNTMFYKYALRSHMGRLNQTGHIFTMNQKIESDSTSPESLKLPRKQSSVEQSHHSEVTVHDTENVGSLLSPIKSPTNEQKKKMNKVKRGETVKDCDKVEGDDPFGTMEVSMEDLETFGMDMSANKTFMKLGEKKNVKSVKENSPVEVCLAAEKKLSAKDSFTVGKATKGQGSEPSGTLKSNELDISKDTELVDSVQETFLSSDVDCKTMDQDKSEKEKVKLAENVQSPKVIGNDEEVVITDKLIPDVMCDKKVDRTNTLIPDVTCDLNDKDSVSNSVEVSDSLKINETLVNTSESKSKESGDSVRQELKVDISSQPCDLQMSSASDDESDALVIDEPENDNIQTVAMETPASPVPETPLSPVLFRSSFGSAFSPPTSPSKRLRTAIDMNDITPRGVMSPDRTDRNSPTSPDHNTFSSPESKPCKIIPLQRDSEEEFVTDNSYIYPRPVNLFYPVANLNEKGLRRKVEEISEGNTESKPSIDILSTDLLSEYKTSDNNLNKIPDSTALGIKTVQLSDDTTVLKSDLHKCSVTQADEVPNCIYKSGPDSLCTEVLIMSVNCANPSVQNPDSDTSNTACGSHELIGGSHNVETVIIDTNTGRDNLESSDNEMLQINTALSKDDSESSDEIVSPRSKILRKNKDRGKNCDGQKTKLRAAVIESDSESDEEIGSKQHPMTDRCSTDTISPLTSSEMIELGKRPLSRSNSTENVLQPSQRKRHKSNKSIDVKTEGSMNVEGESENLAEMACTRRKTRSSVGLRKQETILNKKTLEKQPSSPKKCKSVDDDQPSDFCEESMPTKRQTRRSMDSQDQEQRSSKLAILDRVKKNLRSV